MPERAEDKKEKTKLSRQERIEKERERLISKLSAHNMNEIRVRVAYIMSIYPETRNSDIALIFRYWETFHPEHLLHGNVVDMDAMFKLERYPSIVRARAKIQNEYKLFLADEEVRLHRRSREVREKEEQLADQPGIPGLIFYIDESGITQDFIVVGGLCCSDSRRAFEFTKEIIDWRSDSGIKHEFHFTRMGRLQLSSYKEFFDIALKYLDVLSFRAVIMRRPGIKRPMDETMNKLHYQLVHKSVEYEEGTGRIALPRQVTMYKDKAEGVDPISIAELDQALRTGFSSHFNDKLMLNYVEDVDSKANYLIQLADQYVGSISRILNREPSASKNHKDELAEHIVSHLGINLDDAVNDLDIASVHFL